MPHLSHSGIEAKAEASAAAEAEAETEAEEEAEAEAEAEAGGGGSGSAPILEQPDVSAMRMHRSHGGINAVRCDHRRAAAVRAGGHVVEQRAAFAL